jgi:hypothetical protein
MTFRETGKKIDDLVRDLKKRFGIFESPPTNPSVRERFHRWFKAPVDALSKELDDGDGAFVVMSIGFFLCERYFRSMTGNPDNWQDQSFKALAAAHFDINLDFFEDFWNVYRNGIQHQGSPKRETIQKKQTAPNQPLNKPGYPIEYRWRIDGSFDSMPQKAVVGGVTYICINPFGFTHRIIALWHADEPGWAN